MANSYPFRRTVTLTKDSTFHHAHPGSSGPVRVPMTRNPALNDDPHNYRDDQLDAFKASIYRQGYASCPEPNCRLSFLSLAGIVAHKKNCSGFLRQGDFVTCSFCEARFCQFKSLQTHQERNHGEKHQQQSVCHHHEEEDIVEESFEAKHECVDNLETLEEQNSRIMMESRRMSNPRPRGRPPKCTNKSIHELDYSYYTRHSSRYTVLDTEPEEDPVPSSNQLQLSPSRILKVRTNDGNILYVRPATREQLREEENMSSSSSTSGSARSAHKTYSDEQKPRRPNHVGSIERLEYVVDDVKTEEERTSAPSRASTSSSASKKNSLEEQRAILEAYEEIVLRSEALAENARKKINEKNDLLKKEKDLKSWEEDLRRREAKAQRTINEALYSLGADSLDDCVKNNVIDRSSNEGGITVIDLCDDIDKEERNDCYILPDSTHSVRSVGSGFSVSSYSINEDNMSDSISIAASLTKESNSLSSPEPLGNTPSHISDLQNKQKERLSVLANDLNGCDSASKKSKVVTGPRKVSKKNIGRGKRSGKSGRNLSLHRQIKQFLNSIDTSSLRAKRTASESSDVTESTPSTNSVGSSNGGIKVIRPVKIPSSAEPSNFKSTPSGVKYIVPSNISSRSPQSEGDSIVEGRIHKSRNELISELITNPSDGKCLSSSTPNCAGEVISSDLPISFSTNEDSIAAEGETKETMDTSNLDSYILVKSPTISIIDVKDHFYPLPENTEEINESFNNEDPSCPDENSVSTSSGRSKRGRKIQTDCTGSNAKVDQPFCDASSFPLRTTRSSRNKGDSVNSHSPSAIDEEPSPRQDKKSPVPTSARSKRCKKTKKDCADSSTEVNNSSHHQSPHSEDSTLSTPFRSTRSSKKQIVDRLAPYTSTTEISDACDEECSIPTTTPTRSTRASRRKTDSVERPSSSNIEINDSIVHSPDLDEEGSSTSIQDKSGRKRKAAVTPRNEDSVTDSPQSKTRGRTRRTPKILIESCVDKETPNKRGPKRRRISITKEAESPDKLRKKSTPKKNKSVTKFNCGKCDKSYSDSQGFKVHIASVHGGLAREAGRSQDFTEKEIDVAIKQAFKLIKSVVCYKCNKSSFTTRPGLIYHAQRCGKTLEELDAEKVPCPHCPYRGFPSGLKLHMKVHLEPTPLPPKVKSVVEEQISSGGRVRRSAACRASKIMNETIASLQEEGDECDKDLGNSANDQEFKLTDEINVDGKYKKVGSKSFQCKVCNYQDSTRKGVICHIISNHPEDDDHEEDLSEEEEKEALDVEEKPSYVDTPVRRSVKYRPYGSCGKWKALYPCNEHMANELNFRIANYCSKGDLFQTFMSNEFCKVSQMSEAESYLPISEESISFTFKGSSEKKFSESVSLKRFEGSCLGGVPTFFAGGPIWTLEWAPQTGEKEEFFALSSHRSMDDVSAMFSLDFGLGIIQIWSGGVLKATQDGASAPVFKYGLLHDYGKIWCLKWCPSGTDTADYLGLLAAGCSNGNIYIHRMRRPDADETSAFYNHAPEMCLRPLRESFGQCLKLSWYNGKGHRVLGASYSGGKIALYDLLTNSVLLKKGSVIYPYKVLHVHTSSVNAIDLLGTEPFPRYCATGSFDRHFSVWDLNDPSVPIVNGKKGLVTDLHFFRSFPGGHISMSHDDVYLQSHTQTVISVPDYSRVRTQPILCHNSAIRNESLNFWLGTLGVGTSAGEVIVFVAPQNISSLETDKLTTRRRTLISRTSVSHKDLSKNSHKYDECKDNIGEFGYVNMNINDFYKNPESEMNATRSAERLALEDITNYPMAAINRLSFNPNFRSCSWLLSGSQNGIGRLHNVKALLHSSFPTVLETYINLFECSE